MSEAPTLRKPPVTEVYADCVFEGGPAGEWSPEGACRLLEQMMPGSAPEFLPKVDYQVVQGSEGAEIHLNPRFDRARAWSADRRECIQIGPNRLVVNRVKHDDYPSFRHLEPLLQRHFGRYCVEYKPVSVVSVALGYVDDIHVPRSTGEVIDLQGYFTVSVSSPTEYGPMSGFTTTIKWQSDPNATTQLEFRSVAGYNFQLHWLAGKVIRSSVDFTGVWKCLKEAHERINRYFFGMFTPAGIALFDPVSE